MSACAGKELGPATLSQMEPQLSSRAADCRIRHGGSRGGFSCPLDGECAPVGRSPGRRGVGGSAASVGEQPYPALVHPLCRALLRYPEWRAFEACWGLNPSPPVRLSLCGGLPPSSCLPLRSLFRPVTDRHSLLDPFRRRRGRGSRGSRVRVPRGGASGEAASVAFPPLRIGGLLVTPAQLGRDQTQAFVREGPVIGCGPRGDFFEVRGR